MSVVGYTSPGEVERLANGLTAIVQREASDFCTVPVYDSGLPMPYIQTRVGEWMLECFGAEIAADKVERNDRFIEEALELVQATGYTPDRAHALVDYVFGRPAGEPGQEVGGVEVTLAALCNVHGINIADEARREVDRITTPEMVEKIRAKQAAKPTGSALPIASASAAGVEEADAKLFARLLDQGLPIEGSDDCAPLTVGDDGGGAYLTLPAAYVVMPIGDGLRDAVAHASDLLSAHLGRFHDYEEDTPAKDNLRGIMHHLDGSLTSGVALPTAKSVAAPAGEAVAIPVGWYLVPEVPTEEQMQAGLYQSSHDSEYADVCQSYMDMVRTPIDLPEAFTHPAPASDDAAPAGEAAAWAFEIELHDGSWRADLSYTKPHAPHGGAIRNVRPLAAASGDAAHVAAWRPEAEALEGWHRTYRLGEGASTWAHLTIEPWGERIWSAPSGHDTVANSGSYAPPTHFLAIAVPLLPHESEDEAARQQREGDR